MAGKSSSGAVELGVEERLPQLLDDSAPAVPLEPLEERLVIELVVLLGQLAARDEHREPGPFVRAEQWKRQELLRRGHGEEPPVSVEADSRRPETPLVTEPELVGEADDPIVARQDDVVEAIDGRPVEVEGPDQPAQVRRPLEERHGGACLREPKCGGHPEDATADDPDTRLHPPSAPSGAAGTGSGALARSRKSIRQ